MNKYTYWYKKEVQANNLQQANKQIKNLKPILDGVKVDEEVQPEKLTPCIGFQVYDN